jgi:hypothetical protein
VKGGTNYAQINGQETPTQTKDQLEPTYAEEARQRAESQDQAARTPIPRGLPGNRSLGFSFRRVGVGTSAFRASAQPLSQTCRATLDSSISEFNWKYTAIVPRA